MKFRIFRNSLKESLKNIFRHPLVTVASISTVALMLVLLGAFTVISLNANHMIRVIAQKPAVSVWVEPKVSAQALEQLEGFIKSYPGMVEYEKLTPQQNYDYLVKELGEGSTSLQGYNPELLPYTFNVRFVEPELAPSFRLKVIAYEGVSEVNFEKELMAQLNRIVRFVNYASLIAFGIMCIVTLFIISNMVRISVFSRSEEIGIMKYVGATNSYIRLPYLMEGALTGLFGAVIAWALIQFSYKEIYQRLLKTATGASFGIADGDLLLPIFSVSWKVLAINLLLGVFIGALGSAMSVRKHIRV